MKYLSLLVSIIFIISCSQQADQSGAGTNGFNVNGGSEFNNDGIKTVGVINGEGRDSGGWEVEGKPVEPAPTMITPLGIKVGKLFNSATLHVEYAKGVVKVSEIVIETPKGAVIAHNLDALSDNDPETYIELDGPDDVINLEFSFEKEVSKVTLKLKDNSSNNNIPINMKLTFDNDQNQSFEYSVQNMWPERDFYWPVNGEKSFTISDGQCPEGKTLTALGQCYPIKIFCEDNPEVTDLQNACEVLLDGKVVNCLPASSSQDCLNKVTNGHQECASYSDYLEYDNQFLSINFVQSPVLSTVCQDITNTEQASE